MELKAHICRYCGNRNLYKENEFYICHACGTKFLYDIEEKKLANEIKKLADEAKMERVSALRHQLCEKVNAEYTDSEEIIAICRDLRSFLPEDFLACFYAVANGGTLKEYAKFLNKIDAHENYPLIEGIVRFTIKSLQGELILPLGNLIERTYKSRDLNKYSELQSALEAEAEKVEGGIYDVNISRRAFILYSSKDMDRVMELVSVLEDEGISCFVAQRNLQHGKGAAQNYQRKLETAIDNCKCVVFVSSKNSRRSDCDAFRIELPYIKRRDKEEAPHEYRRGDYENLPQKYKKPRIEYMIELPTEKTAADRTVQEFFAGLEYCYQPEQVADRIFSFDSEVYEDENAELKRQFAELRKQMLAGKKAEEQAETERLRTELEEMKRKQAEQSEADRLRAEEETKRKQAEQSEADRLRAELEEMKRKQAEQGEADRLRAEEETKRKQAEQSEEEMKPKQAEQSEEEMKRKQAELSEADRLHAEEEKTKVDEKSPGIEKDDETHDLAEECRIDSEIVNGCLKKYNGKANKVIIPDGVTSIGDSAFKDCKSLTSVIIPNSVTSIGNWTFSDCTNLTSIEIPDSVTSIGDWAFSDCKSLASVVIPDSVTSIGGSAFRCCTKLTSIEIPNSVTSIGDWAFSDCTSLTNIEVNENNGFYKSIDGNLYTKDSKILIQYALGKNNTNFKIPNSVTSIGNCAFWCCKNLTSIEIPKSVTSIGRYAFAYCGSLTSVIIPNSVTYVSYYAFAGYNNLTIHVFDVDQLDAWDRKWNPHKRPIINDKTGKPAKMGLFGKYK